MEKASLPPSHSPGQAAAPVPPGPRLVSILSPTPKLSTPTTQWCLNVPELESAHPSLITSLWTPDTSFPTFLCGTYLCVFFLFFKLDIFFIYTFLFETDTFLYLEANWLGKDGIKVSTVSTCYFLSYYKDSGHLNTCLPIAQQSLYSLSLYMDTETIILLLKYENPEPICFPKSGKNRS